MIMSRYPASRPARPAVRARIAVLFAGVLMAGCALPGIAQDRSRSASQPPAAALPDSPVGPGYVDLLEMTEGAEIVLIAAITRQVQVQAERSPGLAPGHTRLYLEAETEAVLGGSSGIGADIVFLADHTADSRGRPPRIEGQRYLLFARPVPGRPREIQLISQDAMLPADPGLVERTRTVLRQLVEGPPLPQVTGVREVISVAGNLAGESETQLFLETAGGEPVSLTALRRPGQAPEWGVSWTDIVDPSARPPEAETLAWYRLACFLPRDIPEDAFLQEEADARARARADYAFMLDELGPCERGSA